MAKEQEELGKQHDLFSPDIHNSFSHPKTEMKKAVGISNEIQSDKSVDKNYMESNMNVGNKTQNSHNKDRIELEEPSEMEGFFSPEEKEAVSQLALSQIAHELDRRNNLRQEGSMEAQLYTGPYGRIHSPFKKYSSFQGFPCGVKRSPRKLSVPAAKRTKLFHKGNSDSSGSDVSPNDKTPDKNDAKIGNVGSGVESSDDDQWEIVEEDLPEEIDKALNDKSSKFSLSVMNVKSIIHKIITNESVVEMVRKAVLEEMDEHEMKFEPKMTRSKLKEFEAQGQVPLNWGLSPRKKRQSPNFLEMELPDDEEEDEDFTPTLAQESDEDSESVQSSCYSDIGSPMPSTPKSMPSTPQSLPSTPTVIPSQCVSVSNQADNDLSTHIEHLEENTQSIFSPMGPPLQTIVPKSGGLGKKYQDAMEREKQKSEEDAELIASRTRSKFPMKDCSILDIEASFVAPDITQDMYETCDDLDWAEFLSTLIKFPDDTIQNLNTTNEEEDTEDDPEYNFQEEIDTLEYDREDFRDDRAVKVSKKEMNMLLDDVLNSDGDYDTIDEQYKITIKTQSEKIVFNSNKKKQSQYQQSLISAIGDHERKQIDDQLRKHVQQLAQTYVMSQNGIAEHKPMGHTARFYLNELKNFAEKSETMYGASAYRACNLDQAIHVVDDQSWQQEVEVPQDIKERMEALTFKHESLSLPAFSYGQMLVMWTSPVFMFPELLPQGGFFRQVDIKRDRARVKFLEPEDNLLAMGVAQFSHLKKDAKDYIQRFMLPCKSRKQIEIRIKNLSAKAAKDNAVKFFRAYKRLPRFPQHASDFDIHMMKSLKESHHDWDELPWWCRFFSNDECISNESMRNIWERQREIRKRRKERLSVSFTLSESDIAAMLTPPHTSASAPVTPHQQTDSSVSGSSGSETAVILATEKRKRPRRPSRKKLNMNKQKKNEMGIVGSFVPLPLPGSSIPQPQPSPLTICVLENIPGISPDHQTVSPSLGTLPGNVAVSSTKPTILVINKNASMQQQSFNQAVTSDTALVYSQSATPFTQISSTVPLSMPLIGTDSSKNESDIDTKSLTFEDICRPIMEAEMAELGQEGSVDVTEKELCRLYTDKSLVCGADSIKTEVNVVEGISKESTVVDNVENVSINSTNMPSSASAAVICQSLNIDNLNNSTCEIQSSEISSTVLKDQSETSTAVEKMTSLLDNATPELATPDLNQEVTKQVESDLGFVLSVQDQNGDKTKVCTNSLMESRCTPTQDLHSDTVDNNELTSEQLHASSDVSSSEKNQKSSSSLEVVASLAHYFMSPVRTAGSLQYTLERTPTKKKLPFLAPKSDSPRERNVTNLFSELKCTPRRKVKSSPRKKRLQHHVKTILPKGFVISSFDLSPAKKAASSLVDKAKHLMNSSKKFCKILPRPANQIISERHGLSTKTKKRRRTKNSVSVTKQDLIEGSGTRGDSKSDHVHDDGKENNNYNQMGDEDDRCGETESDYTQSEDGNETQGTDGEDMDTQGTDDLEGTQGTDGDSQDSQEEDSHIADLMAASTTMGFVPRREDLYSVSRLGKKDRKRDMTLALLKPDIVAADPQRDLRDTLFAQAYIHKVKKVLRDDVDKLEKFLRIMYNFSQDGTSPVKLYNDLQELFSSQPELIYDFASFLQAEQALQCGCYKAYQEFNNARKFLRKLEIFFMKNPNQLQKVMRTFSRWYKKPGRKESDIREQIEPILKGQKLLLEEFSMFFPDERPSESVMEDFEEVDLDNSGENEDKDTSFEEINLLDLEEVYGTKRCPCHCHGEIADDTYRKRKKHCYSCCLTVIDGELVYKVNKTTIKKINVTYGPPVKLSSLLDVDMSEIRTNVVDSMNGRSQEPDSAKGIALETENREPASVDWILDQETAEKENIEHFSDDTNNERDGLHKKAVKGKYSPSKELFQQKISKLPRNQPQEKHARLSSLTKENSLSPKLKGEGSTGGNLDQHQNFEPVEIDKVKQLENEANRTENNDKINSETSENKPSLESSYSPKENQSDFSSSKIIKESDQVFHKRQITKEVLDRSEENEKKSEESHKDNECVDVSNDILASAFSSALNTDVSMDSMCFPFNISTNNTIKSTGNASIEPKISMHDLNNKSNIGVSNDKTIKPTAVTCELSNSMSVSAPLVQNNLHVSNDSPFQKVQSSENSESTQKDSTIKETNILSEQVVKVCEEAGLDNEIPCKISNKDYVLEASKSPLNPSFSPMSPFAQEIQNITSVQSPLTTVQSPGVTSLFSSTGKTRRITPIPVKGPEEKTNSQSPFQTAKENSPVIHHFTTLSSPYGNTKFTESQKVENFTNIPPSSLDNSQGDLSKEKHVFTVGLDTESQKPESTSQKSDSNSTESMLSANTFSKPGLSSMVISQPEIFSENANVSFPKGTTSTTNMSSSHSEILSEESLFNCITKPSQLTDSIPCVSNLTNILHALDGHSQGNMLHGHSPDDENQNTECATNTAENSDGNSAKDKQNENISCLSDFVGSEGSRTFEKINDVEKVYKDSENEFPNDKGCESGFGESSKNQTVNHQSVINNKNTENTTGELLKVTDNDTSLVSTPSVTEMIVKEKDNRKVNISEIDDSVSERKDKEKKHKMSRRELRRSLQGKVLNEHENVEDTVVNNASEGQKVNDAKNDIVLGLDNETEVQLKKEINSSYENVKNKEDSSKKLDFDGPVSLNEVSNECETDIRSGEIKTEESDAFDNPCMSDVQSISDTVSEASSRGHKKSKHSKSKHKSDKDKDKHRKKRRKTETNESDSTQKADKKKRKKSHRKSGREKLEASSSVLETEKSTASIEKDEELQEDDNVTVSKDKGSQETEVREADDMVPISNIEEKRDDEPKWSKETDKTILENCKVHGIKEKTFVRIAKEIGNVSARQVRKRFDQLYQMIFGVSVAVKANE